jgi:hypothetical protein
LLVTAANADDTPPAITPDRNGIANAAFNSSRLFMEPIPQPLMALLSDA